MQLAVGVGGSQRCGRTECDTLRLTDFGFFGGFGRSQKREKREKQAGNRDISRFLTAEWRTGTRYRSLRRCGPNWRSWSWSYRRVSTWCFTAELGGSLPGSAAAALGLFGGRTAFRSVELRLPQVQVRLWTLCETHAAVLTAPAGPARFWMQGCGVVVVWQLSGNSLGMMWRDWSVLMMSNTRLLYGFSIKTDDTYLISTVTSHLNTTSVWKQSSGIMMGV